MVMTEISTGSLRELVNLDFEMDGIRAPQTKALCLLATYIPGWDVHRTNSGVTFTHRDAPTFVLPTNESSLRDGVMRRRTATLMRHAPPMDHASLATIVDAIADTVKLRRDLKRRFVNAVFDHESVPDTDTDDTVEPAPEPEEIPMPETATREIVSLEPARAVKGVRTGGGAETYESQTTLERTWSDGTVDYPCRWNDCDYVGPSLRSTSNHYRAHESGVTTDVGSGFDVAHVAEPRIKSRIARLAASIADAQAATDSTDPAVVAEWIINERVARDDNRDAEPDELDADQILDRIARLVDRGETPKMMTQIMELRETIDAVRAERDEARGAISTLRDLMPIYEADGNA